jgi:hypothetical protein
MAARDGGGSVPERWGDRRGQRVTVEGTAVDAMAGAMVLRDDGGESIWIDGLDHWPKGYYRGGDDGRHVRVTGIVIERDDLPALVEQPGEQKQGIPVKSEAELAGARHRYLLTDAKWSPL